jgi:hypothetical protein
MRRGLLLLVAVALLLNLAVFVGDGSGVRPVRAADVPALAAYAPPESVLYLEFRTDDAFIDALDDLRRQIVRSLPPGMMPADISLRALLALAFQSAGVNFENEVRPWLGERAALFVGEVRPFVGRPNLSQGDLPAALVFGISDRAAAIALIDQLLAQQPMLKEALKKGEEGTYTVYRAANPSVEAAIAVNDNALIIGTDAGIDAATAMRGKLFEQASFVEVMALLPEKSYNVLAYVDSPQILELSQAAMGTSSPMTAGDRQLFEALSAAIGANAIGATILDDRTLVLDSVQQTGDLSKLTALGLSMPTYNAVDPAFLANIPSTAAAVVHGTDLKGLIDSSLATLVGLEKWQVEQRGTQPVVEKQIAQFEAELLKNTGISLRNDILNWLTGDFAIIAGYQTPAPGTPTLFTVPLFAPGTDIQQAADWGLIFEATDAPKAAALVAKLETLLAVLVKDAAQGNPRVRFSTETIGGVEVIVLSLSQEMDTRIPQFSVDLIIGANDKVFVIATRKLAEAILTGFPGLDSGKTYQEAAKYLLPNSAAVAYLSREGFTMIGDLLVLGTTATRAETIPAMLPTPGPTPAGDPQARAREAALQAVTQAQAVVRVIANLFDSATISASVNEDNVSVSRAVITLAK